MNFQFNFEKSEQKQTWLQKTYAYKICFVSFYLVGAIVLSIKGYVANRIRLLRCIYIALKYRRTKNKKYDVGLGPYPLINNVYHKQALEKYGYKANTFVYNVYHITSEFDFNSSKDFTNRQKKYSYYITWFRYVVKNHKSVYIYFNGCALGGDSFLSKYEAFLLKLAKVKVVVMPYGGDIQDFSKSNNLIFRNAMTKDYPVYHKQRELVRRNVVMWTQNADHIISGCDWVEYLYHWDTLTLAHFSIDTERWKPSGQSLSELNDPSRPFKIFHAPNHVNQKGTKHFIKAIEELKKEGLNVELVMAQKVPNAEIKRIIETVDVVADQLIIGWYAMFALEAMSLEKPVLCYLNPALENLYIEAGLVEIGEIPIINCNPFNVKSVIKELYENRTKLKDIGMRSREFVKKHHSIEYIGSIFDRINSQIGVEPSQPGKQ